jgi:phospholipase D1/2
MFDSKPQSTLFRPGENCCAVAQADRAAWLIDGAAYFDAFVRAAERAQRSILILAWDFDSRTPLRFDRDGRPALTLGPFLNTLAKRQRNLHIRVLNWDYPMVFGHDREFPPLYGLSWRPHRRVHFRYDSTHPLAGSHHQKIVVIDDQIAFVGGLDLTNKRWDTSEHRPNDPRRTAGDKPYPPFHDAMMLLDGEAAGVLAGVARKRWQAATGESLPAQNVLSDSWPSGVAPRLEKVRVGVACTAPECEAGNGVREIEQLYLDMIARARRLIYIENQYFTSAKIGDALAARLAEDDPPEIVLVTRLLSHGWLEEMTMHVLRTRLVKRLQAVDRHGRFQVYYPHVEGLADGTCIDMHSKVMIVDDEWLRIGSSNLSNRSMGLDSECDVVVEAQGDAQVQERIRTLRLQLLGEHMGVAPDHLVAEIALHDGMHAAIAACESEHKGLRSLEALPEHSEALINTVALADPERPVSLERLIHHFAPMGDEKRGGGLGRTILIGVAFFAVLAALWRFTPLAEWVTADRVTQWAESFAGHWWAPLVLIAAYIPACVILFPRPLLTLAAVVAFGPWMGFGVAMTGVLIAAAGTYLLGRLMPRDRVRRMCGPRLNSMCETLRHRGLIAVTALRLVPIAPFAVEGLVAGAIRIKLSDFLLGTFLGMAPGSLATTVFGQQLETALRDPSSINYGLIATAAVLFAAFTFFVRRWLIKSGQSLSA